MANHASALKRARQADKRKLTNRVRKSAMRTAIKLVNTAVESGDKDGANTALQKAIPLIDRAGRKRVIHPNTASRSVSRLVARVKAMSA